MLFDNTKETFCNWCNEGKDYMDLHHEGFCKLCWIKFLEFQQKQQKSKKS